MVHPLSLSKGLLTEEAQNADLQTRVDLIGELLDVGAALSSITDLDTLLTLILSKSREITCSDAGSVFLIDREDEFPRLLFKVAQNDSLPHLSFKEFAVPLNPKSLSGYVALTGESLNIADAYEVPEDHPYRLDRSFDEDFNYRTCSVLVLPMQDQQGEIIGVLQLLNRKHRWDLPLTPDNTLDAVQPYADWEERILRSLASQAAISIERNILQRNIENLFEGFVKASIQAIESRDPTTSGHSERVATLTVRLSEEVNTVEAGPLSGIFFDHRQLQEIRYASLLHDFGKIGVPEAILNKRKKLYPENLEIIRQRFRVAQRTLELHCAQNKYRHLVEHPDHRHQHPQGDCPHCQTLHGLEQDLGRAIAQLEGFLAIVEEFNEPEAIATRRFEAMDDELFETVTALANYRYRDVDGSFQPLVTENDLAQLLLPRGNLTTEERLAIESHVTHSFEFLKKIPWTKHLQEIPVIAYGHHEKLDGTGYPRGIRGEEIPLQTQMMAVSDIYDALTARDRPYKKPLPIHVVLRILREEADKHKINRDLVQVFEQRQVFQSLGHHLEQ